MMSIHFQAVALGIASGTLLTFLYRAVRDDWPQLYTYDKAPLERTVQKTFFRYLTFRTLPPLLAFYATGVTAERIQIDPRIAVASTAASFLLLTTLRAAALTFRHSTRPTITLLLQLTSTLWTSTVAFAAYFTRDYAYGLVPSPDAFIEAAWSAIFVVTLIKLVSTAMRSDNTSDKDLVDIAKKNMGVDVWEYARKSSERAGIPSYVILAIMTTESLQRPRWTRRLENIAAALTPGNYRFSQGVTQELHSSPLGDIKAIDITLDNLREILSDTDIKILHSGNLYLDDNEKGLTARDICAKVAATRNCDVGYERQFIQLCIAIRERYASV
ncbi:hypothetical protein H6X68_00130 [Actinomyces sp. 186855]|nr:hypothetical protein [Actinomyces sp. 186855]